MRDIWVLGRTQNTPRQYYIRRRARGGEWEPWEEVPLKIEGDNVALVRNNDRLYLFWLMVHKASSTPGKNDSSFDASNLSIAWSEHTLEGWSRINMSERSPAIVAKHGSEPDSYRLQFWNVGDEVHLLALRYDGSVHPTALFKYDSVAKHIRFVSNSFDENDPANAPYLLAGNILKSSDIIALWIEHQFEGQRYAKKGKNQDAGARFHQGDFSARIFKNNPEKANVAFVHQADIWDPDFNAQFTPVVYDDRRRKYLLEPTLSPVGPGTEGDDLSPKKLGPLELAGYIDCLEPSIKSPLAAAPPQPKAQLIKDGMAITKAFSAAGVPGQQPELAKLHGIPSLNIKAGNEEGALMQAANTQGGDINYDNGNDVDVEEFKLKIAPLYHPYAHEMIHRLSRNGLPGIYDTTDYPTFTRQLANFDALGAGGLDADPLHVWGEAPVEQFDFGYGTTYGVYNWEIFYHVPTLIAHKLSTDQRFEEAQNWLHEIFDPIRVVEGETGPEKFWRIKPFYEQAQDIAQDQFEAMLGIGVSADQQDQAIDDFEKQVDVWRANPFDPHAIARVRPGVYQRALLMQYFDNLIAWADNLFRRDTIESINEATMLYMLVGQLLGERPREVPGPDAAAKSYDELASEGLDALANAAVQLENWVLVPTKPAKLLGCVDEPKPGLQRQNVPIRFWYFCYPPNPELLGYWDTIDDRLWKIRHCQNIDGVVRQLALFQPPIDPALLVAAVAAGVDITSALAELDSGLPPYRFRYIWGRAQSITGELRSLGGALLSALEKRDGEELAALRAGQEVSMLHSVRQVRQRRIEEAEATLESLRLTRATIQHRRDHYSTLYEGHISGGEQSNLDKLEQARNHQISASVHKAVAGVLTAFPNILVGSGGFVDWGGEHIGPAVSTMGDLFAFISTEYSYQAGKALTNAQYERRRTDWAFQRDAADKELSRLEQDRASAEIRLAIARRELEDHDLQVRNAREIELYMHDKYTDRQLYDWMVGQLSTLYFQTYQLAFDLAKRAERAYRHELAILEQAQPIIKYGYWDSLRRGLLAGERLAHDLGRLDIAYMDKDVREYELRKSVSLAQLNPAELLELQETGECTIALPELLFDMDHPGHYLRRTRAVRVTIPAVVGPYTTLGATLQLVSHTTRINADVDGGYTEGENDDRFVHGFGGGQAIATSTAVTDAGLFQLDFRDERYLPFEYTGAISTWKLRLPDPAKAPQFDYRTISDVVIHVDYTAREGGEDLRTDALDEVESILQADDGGYQVFVVQDAFPNEWEKFLAPTGSDHELTLPVTEGHFPYFAQRAGFEIDKVDVHLVLDESVTTGVAIAASTFFLDTVGNPPPSESPSFVATTGPGNYTTATADPATAFSAVTWKLVIPTTNGNIPAAIDDGNDFIDRTTIAGMILVAHYSLT